MSCPENDPLKLKRPNPSETFEMSLRGSGNYTITVKVTWVKLEMLINQCVFVMNSNPKHEQFNYI